MRDGPILADPALAMAAQMVEQLEDARKGAASRLKDLTTPAPEGFGLTLHNPDVMRLAELFGDLEAAEAKAIKNLQRAMRAHKLGDWQRSRKYVGEKQLGRLLGSIRDPYWHDREGRPRKLRELYAYCGMHVLDSDTGAHHSADSQGSGGAGVAPKRRRGTQCNWNENARSQLWNIAKKQIQGPGAHYRPLYDESRIKCADAIHTRDCAQCGTKGKPAQPGTPLRPGHQNARAIRIVAKQILRDLWEESRRLHTETTGWLPNGNFSLSHAIEAMKAAS